MVEYDVLEYKNAAETGESLISIYAGEGRIVSIEGHYTPANDSFTSLDPDGKTQYYYTGGYTDWSGGNARWHHIRVEIEGATPKRRYSSLERRPEGTAVSGSIISRCRRKSDSPYDSQKKGGGPLWTVSLFFLQTRPISGCRTS